MFEKMKLDYIDKKIERRFKELLYLLDKRMESGCSKCNLRLKGCQAKEHEKIILLLNLLRKNKLEKIMQTQCASFKSDIQAHGGIFVQVGSSMYPTIKEGDIAIMNTKEFHKKGNIILYGVDNDTVCVHRIVGIDGDLLYTMGDNNNVTEVIHKNQYISTVTSIIKRDENKELWEWLHKQLVEGD